jgi:hypothetical protein
MAGVVDTTIFPQIGRIAVDGDTAQASAHVREIARIKGR